MRLCYDQPRLPRINFGRLLFAVVCCWNMGTLAQAQGDNYPQLYPRAKPSGLSSGGSVPQRQQQRAEVNSAAKEGAAATASSPSHASPVAGSQGRALTLPTPYQAPRYVMPQRGLPEEEPLVGTTANERSTSAGNRRVVASPEEPATGNSQLSAVNQPVASTPAAKPGAMPATKSAAQAGIPLARPDSSKSKDAKKASNPASTSQALTTVISSLGIVLAVFLLMTWFVKKFSPPGTGIVPKEAVELLGRSPLTGRQQMQVVRIGNKLLLVALTVSGAETLTEITDPEEVERLTALCRKTQANSSTASFQQLVTQLESSTTNRGFVDADAERASSRPVTNNNLRSNRSGRA